MRVKAVIAYDGTDFEGFQRQTHTDKTITSAIETALQSLQIHSPITASGRTDAGVHATGQVLHFDLPDFWVDLAKLCDHLNARLQAIHFKHISKASDEFHARFDAKRRVYRYLFSLRKPQLFAQKYIAHVPIDDMQRLQSALALFEGRHDFSAFKKTGSSTLDDIRTIHRTRLKKYNNVYAVYFEADGFLRAQVRMMLSAAFEVAQEKYPAYEISKKLSDPTLTHTR